MDIETAINKILEICEAKQVNKNRYIITGKDKSTDEILSNVRRLKK